MVFLVLKAKKKKNQKQTNKKNHTLYHFWAPKTILYSYRRRKKIDYPYLNFGENLF